MNRLSPVQLLCKLLLILCSTFGVSAQAQTPVVPIYKVMRPVDLSSTIVE